MLVAAGIPTRGAKGCARVSGLMCLYGRVVPVWIDDEDPDLGPTMAALDRELRSGERCRAAVEAISVVSSARRPIFDAESGVVVLNVDLGFCTPYLELAAIRLWPRT